MDRMFDGATAFDQDLCHFGDNFNQYKIVYNMFVGSGCANKSDPTSETGPWCAVTNCLYRFTINTELRDAIKEYLGQDCPSDLNCQARSNYGGAIGEWDVSSVDDFSRLFVDDSDDPIDGAATFNEPLNWDTGSATMMLYMFKDAAAFNQPLSTFDTSKVNNMFGMFSGAAAFNRDLTAFDTSEVEDVSVLLC
ncbi:hypothetical protein THAOC_15398 [Thalassiosira oceanica]|uniref:BspA family leucine-rich repeat surface protein n=1 Tax=Thalassiosira oceanica TaxID=159749 RepID=K0SCQ4_THAOC|nr:hypothetical protein THAOC_15398 [Thalassiosira oceanica]|eukprot:EJK63918.1 hypothetical protein THAOC_15398 [Thalassiosira oceanica]